MSADVRDSTTMYRMLLIDLCMTGCDYEGRQFNHGEVIIPRNDICARCSCLVKSILLQSSMSLIVVVL